MATRSSARRLKKSIIPYLNDLAGMKVQDLYLRQQSQYISILKYALKKNVVPVVAEIKNDLRSTYDDARRMFFKMISEAATAIVTDEEKRELSKMHTNQSCRIGVLDTKLEELQGQFREKFNVNIVLQPWSSPPFKDTYEAYTDTIIREIDSYSKMYESLIRDLPSLNISNASDASVDLLMKRFIKLDEATVRGLLDKWVAFKRDCDVAMEKFNFIVYLLDNKSDLIFKGDYEGLTNVVRWDDEVLATNHREEAVSKLLQDWSDWMHYKPKGVSKKKVKSFKEMIQQEKEQQYRRMMHVAWVMEAFGRKYYRSDLSDLEDIVEPTDEDLTGEDAIPEAAIAEGAIPEVAIAEGVQVVEYTASPGATHKRLLFVLDNNT